MSSTPIVQVTLPAQARNALGPGNLAAILHANHFPPGQQAGINRVNGHVATLRPVQKQLLLEALRHSADPSHGHGAQVSFAEKRVDYQLPQGGLEIVDESVGGTSSLTVTFVHM